jgi:hypothetical protein
LHGALVVGVYVVDYIHAAAVVFIEADPVAVGVWLDALALLPLLL